MATIAALTTHSTANESWTTGSRVWRWLIQFCLVALAFLLACNEISDYDIWWHLKTGQLIPQRGIPNTDWYSFTSSDRPWIDVHWGFQLIAATIHSLAGVPGLVILQACVIATTITIALTAYRREWSVWPQFSVMLVALLVMSSRFYVRPEILTLLFTSIFLSVLLHAEERPRLLWILPFVQVLWANVQSLFVFGPILLGMYWAEVILRGRVFKGHVRLLAIVTGLVGVACIVSPYGIWNVMFLADVWQKMDPEAGKFYRATIGELKDVRSFLAEGGWQSGGIYILFLMMFLGAMGVVVRWREILLKREVFRLLPIIAFTWLALQAMRNASHFALVVGIISAWNLGPSFPRKTTEFRPAMVALLLSLFVGIYFVGGRLSEWIGSHRRFGFGTHPEQFSFEAMRICSLAGMPDRAAIFHMGHAANYIYACGPDRKVLMDPRLEVHTEQTLRDYRNLEGELETGTNGPQMLDRFGINLVVAGCEQNIRIQATLFSSPAWKCVHWDPIAAVFVRSTLKLPPGVEEFDFRRGMFDDAAQTPRSDDVLYELTRGIAQQTKNAGWNNDLINQLPKYIPKYPDSCNPIVPRSPSIYFECQYLFNLAQTMASVPMPNETLIRRVAWRCVRRSTRSMDTWKFYARSRGILSILDHSVPRDEDPLYTMKFRGWTITSLRQVFEADLTDVVSGFYLQQILTDAGAMDDAVDVLAQLSKRTPTNNIQKAILPQVNELYLARKKLVEDPSRQPPTAINCWDDIAAYKKYNRLGTLRRMFGESKLAGVWPHLTHEQKVIVGRWLFGVGATAELEKQYSYFGRLSKEMWAAIDDPNPPLAFDQNPLTSSMIEQLAELIRVCDKPTWVKFLHLVNPDECTPAQRKILARFRDLLIDEPDKR